MWRERSSHRQSGIKQCQKLESLGYISLTDTMGLASVSQRELAPKATALAEITREMAITQSKVIQGHHSWYQVKACRQFPISKNKYYFTSYIILFRIYWRSLGEITRKMAITPLKVIQGHHSWYQLKTCRQLPISENEYYFTSYITLFRRYWRSLVKFSPYLTHSYGINPKKIQDCKIWL